MCDDSMSTSCGCSAILELSNDIHIGVNIVVYYGGNIIVVILFYICMDICVYSPPNQYKKQYYLQ